MKRWLDQCAVIVNLKWCGRIFSWPNFKHKRSLEGIEEKLGNRNKNNRPSDRYMNRRSSDLTGTREYETGTSGFVKGMEF
jgi:hypothetical protein